MRDGKKYAAEFIGTFGLVFAEPEQSSSMMSAAVRSPT